ncbi:hypothetical protein [Rhodococcus ruber]|uniref:hypothetical protein n=1 Tax=Rhodococcus ruber TaxID=1830 RepID=UPI0011148858|nr:hypothetical protein [Rhodococcus ruber]
MYVAVSDSRSDLAASELPGLGLLDVLAAVSDLSRRRGIRHLMALIENGSGALSVKATARR